MQIYLSSKYASSYNSNSISDCNFYLPVIEIPSQYHIYLSVQHAVIPYSFYNIDKYNNTIDYKEVSGTFPYTIISSTILSIPIGSYNALQLASYLSSGVLPNLTVVYNSIQGVFIFTNSTNNFILYPNTSIDLLGLSTDYIDNVSVSKKLSSPSVVNLASKQCIHIISNFNTGSINNVLTSNSHNILSCIPILQQPFNNITYTNTNNFKVNLFNNNISSITIKLVDQSGNLLNLNNKHFSLTLQLDIVKFVE